MRYLCGVISLSCSIAFAAGPIDDNIRFEAWGKWALARLDQPPYFLSREELITLPLAVPPANSSRETRAELDELLKLQKERTRAQSKRITKHLEYDGVCAA